MSKQRGRLEVGEFTYLGRRISSDEKSKREIICRINEELIKGRFLHPAASYHI